MINIRDMKYRITIQELVSNNDNGYIEEFYQNSITVWSKVDFQTAKEAGTTQVKPINTIRCTIRNLKTLDMSMWLTFQGKTYSMISIDSAKYLNKYIEIRASEILPKQCTVYRSSSVLGERNRPTNAVSIIGKYSCTLLKRNSEYNQGDPNAQTTDRFNLTCPPNIDVKAGDLIEVDSIKYIAMTPFMPNMYQTEIELIIKKDA